MCLDICHIRKSNLFFFLIFIYLFMAVLCLRFCARAFSGCGKRGPLFIAVRGGFLWCGKRGPLFIAVRGPLTVTASLVAEHRLQTRRLSNCGSRAQLLRGMWGLPRPGLERMCPCIGRQTLNHCATREALKEKFLTGPFKHIIIAWINLWAK